MRPVAYGATGSQDPWLGLAARVVDDQNYLYMTLRRSNQLSLRKKIETSDSTIATSGRSGVLMYRTSADLWQYITYQP